MPTDINFLPPEERPKRKQLKKERETVELAHPALAPRPQDSTAAPATSASKKLTGSIFKLFKKDRGAESYAAPAVTDTTFLPAGGINIKQARESLLQHIKSAGSNEVMAGVKDQAEKNAGDKENKSSEAIKVNAAAPAGAGLSSEHIHSQLAAKQKYFWLSLISSWWQSIQQQRRTQKSKRQINKQTTRSKQPQAAITAPLSAVAAPLPPQSKSPLTAESNADGKGSQDMLRTNLIKGQEAAFFNWRRAAGINIVAVVLALVIIGGAWLSLVLLSKPEIISSPLDQLLAGKELELKQLATAVGELTPLRKKVAAAKDILNNHIYWTNFFNYLETNTLPGITYDKFEGELSGEYVLPAKASSFQDFSAQMKAWQEEQSYILDANTSGAMIKKEAQAIGEIKSEREIISFEINLKVKPEIFQSKE
ncbi:MAG: hypothetical protein AAB956_03305 [Patescibacteria group bacterium]